MDELENIFAEDTDEGVETDIDVTETTDQSIETETIPENTEQDGAQTDAAADRPQTQDTPNAQGADTESFMLKYYGQEVPKSREETISLAQKGMNYDKVYEQLHAVEPAAKLMESVAAQSGMTLQEYVDYAQSAMHEQQLASLERSDVPKEVAEELLQLRQQAAVYKQQEAAAKAQSAEQSAKEERSKQFAALLGEYPEIAQSGQLPQEVVARIAKGEAPLSAYRAYDNARLKAIIAARDADTKNKQTAPGSIAGVGEKQIADEFEKGFDSGFGG